jgi:hypothetical protein
LPRTVGAEHDAIFYLNARNIKLSTRDQNEVCCLIMAIILCPVMLSLVGRQTNVLQQFCPHRTSVAKSVPDGSMVSVGFLVGA